MENANRQARIYVAGPLSTTRPGEDPYTVICENIKKAIDLGDDLIEIGFAPYVPHFTHYHNLHHMHDWETWLRIDHTFLLTCDALIRLPGPSRGADQEVAWANEVGIPVFTSLVDLCVKFRIPPYARASAEPEAAL